MVQPSLYPNSEDFIGSKTIRGDASNWFEMGQSESWSDSERLPFLDAMPIFDSVMGIGIKYRVSWPSRRTRFNR